jgi:ribosomal protein S18 acetylase RimI-like enzyme
VTITIDELELAALPGWRAAEEHRLGDWVLRAASGFTGRANSALAVGHPGLPLDEAIGAVRHWYAQRGLPAMIAVPVPPDVPAGSELDRQLSARGWTMREDAAVVMTGRAGGIAARREPGGLPVVIQSEPGPDWLARYHYRGRELPPAALALLTSAPWQAFGSIRDSGAVVAVGRVAGDGDWAGLTAIEVDPRHRGTGLGAAMTAGLAAAAARRGFGQLYLQVAIGNVAARSLYRKLGFTDHHQYHNRVAPAGSGPQ